MESALKATRKVTMAFNPEVSTAWKKMSWVQLWVDIKLLAIFVQYFIQRLVVFLLFHAFILLIPILVLGIGYSVASKLFIEYLVITSSGLPLPAFVLTLLAYILKRYYFDKKLKRLQVNFETKIYRPLSNRLLVTRTVSLQVRTLNQKKTSE